MRPDKLILGLEPNWTATWPWLRPGSHAYSLGIDVDRATRQLERLYPVDRCTRNFKTVRELGPRLVVDEAQDPPEWGPPDVVRRVDKAMDEIRVQLPLFMPNAWTPWLVTLLLLGDDLGDCPGWELQRKLIRRLQLWEEHDQARFEVGLWAGMRRAGVPVERVPEEVERTADFILEEGGTRVALEAKVIQSSLYAQNLQTLYRAIGHLDLDRPIVVNPAPDPPPHTMRFSPSPAVHAAMRSSASDAFEGAFGWRLRQFLNAWYAERGATLIFNGRHEVPGLGSFEILEPPDPRSWGTEVVEREPPTVIDEARRVLARAKDARGQVLAHGDVQVRAAVLWVSGWKLPAEPASSVLARLTALDPHEFEGLDWIVLLNAHRVNSLACQVDLGARRISTSKSAIDITGMRWYDGLRRWRLFA